MTACVNKKHSRRVAAAISASLVGALTLGAAPAVVMATEAPVDQQVQESGEAFTNGFVQAAFHYGTSTVNYAGDKNVPATVEFVKNQAMVLDEVNVKVKVADKTVDYTIAGDQETRSTPSSTTSAAPTARTPARRSPATSTRSASTSRS